jgi:hypothetical protein
MSTNQSNQLSYLHEDLEDVSIMKSVSNWISYLHEVFQIFFSLPNYFSQAKNRKPWFRKFEKEDSRGLPYQRLSLFPFPPLAEQSGGVPVSCSTSPH